MLFRLHTHFCVNTPFPFPKALRKQFRKSVELNAERGLWDACTWGPSTVSGVEFLREDSGGTLAGEETLPSL